VSGAAAPDSAPKDAIEALRVLCARQPARAEPRVKLARALLAARRAAEAVAPAEQAVALAPKFTQAIKVRDAVIAALTAGDPDLVRLELTCAINPADAEAHLTLGQAYAGLDRPHDAERHFKHALVLGKANDANACLANLYLSVSMFDAAEHYAGAVLAGAGEGGLDDVLFAMAHQTLAAVAVQRGDAAAAEARLDQAYARRSHFRQTVAGAPFTTLVLVSRRAGNIPYQTLLPPRRFDTTVWYMEHARPADIAALPPYALVLNAIGDPDIGAVSDEMVTAFLASCQAPVLNRPERVRATFRHRLARTLAGIPDVVVPDTVRVPTLAEAGLATPVLVRPTASHGGEGLVLARDAAELAALEAPAGDVYVSTFHDTRGADGFYRKYRMIFVDRRPHAYHLAISPHWMVHHQSSGMEGDPARMAEEMAFLRDPAGAIGAKAMAAIAAIGERLDFDYGGVDFTVLEDGRVLVFEANATMLTHLEPEDGPFAAKNPFIQPIIDAFQGHLLKMAAG
jgi:tetratricopeptide (TPR) repeat protein